MPKVRIEDFDDELDEELQFEKFSRTKKTKMKPRTKEGDKRKLPQPKEVTKVKPKKNGSKLT